MPLTRRSVAPELKASTEKYGAEIEELYTT